MKNITVRPLTASDLAAVAALQSAYTAVYPEAPVIPSAVYLSPAYENGRNLFCAFDERGELVGYAPLYPVLMRDESGLPHTLWTEIKADPTCEAASEIKDRLLEQILLRARELTRGAPGHPAHLTFQYFLSETASVEYVLARGCRYTESVFSMRRDLSKDIPMTSPAGGIIIRPWRMESEAEQKEYVQARNECFPGAPIALGDWQYFMQSPHWAVGTTFAAFDGDELVGNAAVFWDEAENKRSTRQVGFTEYIFVRPGWRGRNIAASLIAAGLLHLRQHGLTEAHLEVRAGNEGALRLYRDLGYDVMTESRFYVLVL